MFVTDITRWKELASTTENPIWSDRTQFISTLIDDNCSVLDIGCGNQHLRSCISESCAYTPIDCVSGDGVMVLDFNSVDATDVLLLSKYYVAVCSGVLEYIHDKPAMFAFIRNNSSTAIISYVTREHRIIANNKTNGWDDGITNQEFLSLLELSALTVTRQLSYGIHEIYCVKSIT